MTTGQPTHPTEVPRAWSTSSHGAFVSAAGRPVRMVDVVTTRTSLGLGPWGTYTALPGATGPRLAPRGDGGDRAATRSHVRLAPDEVGGVVVEPAEAVSEAASVSAAWTTGALPLPAEPDLVVPVPRPPSEPVPAAAGRADETLAEHLDRVLSTADYLLLPNRSRSYAVAKRALDLAVALLLLLVTGPLQIALAILIRVDSPGPALFRQQRVTRGGRVFTFYKFRTMHVDARERFPELYDYSLASDEFGAAFYKLADDPRSTRVGRWLRRTTLDELPNVLNVLRGDLSVVGPRPDLPEYVLLYRPEELCCLFTKAGLTGLAQTAGRSLLTVRERLALDMRYVAHQTLLLDVRILLRTVLVVLLGRGAF